MIEYTGPSLSRLRVLTLGVVALTAFATYRASLYAADTDQPWYVGALVVLVSVGGCWVYGRLVRARRPPGAPPSGRVRAVGGVGVVVLVLLIQALGGVAEVAVVVVGAAAGGLIAGDAAGCEA